MSDEKNLSQAAVKIYGICEEEVSDKDREEQEIPLSVKNNGININLDRESLIKGMILSEILEKPKSWRMRRRARERR